MSYLFIKNLFQEKSLYYFHKNYKLKKKKKKKKIFSGFFWWVFYCQPCLQPRQLRTAGRQLQNADGRGAGNEAQMEVAQPRRRDNNSCRKVLTVVILPDRMIAC